VEDFKISTGTRSNFFEMYRKFGHAHSEILSSRGVKHFTVFFITQCGKLVLKVVEYLDFCHVDPTNGVVYIEL
jgi:hypothetical protein